MKSAFKLSADIIGAACVVYTLTIAVKGFIVIGADVVDVVKKRKDRKAQK